MSSVNSSLILEKKIPKQKNKKKSRNMKNKIRKKQINSTISIYILTVQHKQNEEKNINHRNAWEKKNSIPKKKI